MSALNFNKRVHNFCAGPATMPTAVLQKAKHDLLNWHNSGSSVMEISHRSADFIAIAQKAEQDLRKLMHIPDNYRVLFLQGGASLQFSSIVMNLLHGVADYLDTGIWSKKAITEALRYEQAGLGTINVVATAKDSNYTRIPDVATWQLSDNADYFHYCPNETIQGLAMFDLPTVNAPIVADMSSCILSMPIDVSKFGLIYAGAQKNIGPAGLTLVIVRDDLLGKANLICPNTQNYQNQALNDSMLNTPPTFAWYLSGLVFEWLLEQGGVHAIYQQNLEKARRLYACIDNSDFYHNPVDKNYRSIMNIPFTLSDSSLDKVFLEQAAQNGLLNLKGHKAVGGMRASIYNAMDLTAIDDLVSFMQHFECQRV
ncbi:3-phosphoserine/phosphohydroxythreonine aminotransferase [Moraxella macacae 0408225]|uniref:Phosphoserine aminotransferase n=1 Tax=Moraxella macacae 0408225 TaxID=1230338 RepID=L2F6U4_9GAMM|nr:3-phosphoserine/phosphohydroxythreonine transaminase [Moraxella macacae]ELA08605.1 3-phosphoserine/phosphohydroxythreonine aminotransferase [Moraxella macacae 0408225]